MNEEIVRQAIKEMLENKGWKAKDIRPYSHPTDNAITVWWLKEQRPFCINGGYIQTSPSKRVTISYLEELNKK